MSENHERVEVVSCFIPLLGVTVFIFNYKEKIHSQILKWSNIKQLQGLDVQNKV